MHFRKSEMVSVGGRCPMKPPKKGTFKKDTQNDPRGQKALCLPGKLKLNHRSMRDFPEFSSLWTTAASSRERYRADLLRRRKSAFLELVAFSGWFRGRNTTYCLGSLGLSTHIISFIST